MILLRYIPTKLFVHYRAVKKCEPSISRMQCFRLSRKWGNISIFLAAFLCLSSLVCCMGLGFKDCLAGLGFPSLNILRKGLFCGQVAVLHGRPWNISPADRVLCHWEPYNILIIWQYGGLQRRAVCGSLQFGGTSYPLFWGKRSEGKVAKVSHSAHHTYEKAPLQNS